MNKHSENNRARRICAKLRGILHTLKTYEEQIAAIQFNDELSTEEKTALVAKIQNQSKLFNAQKNTLEKRQKELAYEDLSPVAAAVRGRAGFTMLTHTEVIPERASDFVRRVQIHRRQNKCARAFFTVASCYGN